MFHYVSLLLQFSLGECISFYLNLWLRHILDYLGIGDFPSKQFTDSVSDTEHEYLPSARISIRGYSILYTKYIPLPLPLTLAKCSGLYKPVIVRNRQQTLRHGIISNPCHWHLAQGSQKMAELGFAL